MLTQQNFIDGVKPEPLIWAYPVYLGFCGTTELSVLTRQTETTA